jgi:hypothetical protein
VIRSASFLVIRACIHSHASRNCATYKALEELEQLLQESNTTPHIKEPAGNQLPNILPPQMKMKLMEARDLKTESETGS